MITVMIRPKLPFIYVIGLISKIFFLLYSLNFSSIIEHQSVIIFSLFCFCDNKIG